MKKTNLEKIKKDLENGFGKKTMRNGIEYAWYNAHALNTGIQTRAKNARAWRTKVLEIAENGVVTEEKVQIAPNGITRYKKKATAYYVNNVLTMYVSHGHIYEDVKYWLIIN